MRTPLSSPLPLTGERDLNRRMKMSEIEKLQRWKADPRRFVREVFGVVPDAWQDEVLAAFPRNRGWR